jgi:hypothetical protein
LGFEALFFSRAGVLDIE